VASGQQLGGLDDLLEVAAGTHELLAQRGINVRRNYVGNYCTSL
jgi:dihydroxyacetone kinase